MHGPIAAVLAVDVIRVRSGVPGEGGERERRREKEHNRLTRKLGGATRWGNERDSDAAACTGETSRGSITLVTKYHFNTFKSAGQILAGLPKHLGMINIKLMNLTRVARTRGMREM